MFETYSCTPCPGSRTTRTPKDSFSAKPRKSASLVNLVVSGLEPPYTHSWTRSSYVQLGVPSGLWDHEFCEFWIRIKASGRESMTCQCWCARMKIDTRRLRLSDLYGFWLCLFRFPPCHPNQLASCHIQKRHRCLKVIGTWISGYLGQLPNPRVPSILSICNMAIKEYLGVLMYIKLGYSLDTLDS